MMGQSQSSLRENQIESVENLKKRLENGKVLVIDVRNPDEIEQCGKIQTSNWLNIPLSPDLEKSLKMTSEEFKAKYGIEKPGPDSEIVFTCQVGGRGARATSMADNMGFTDVKNLQGGHMAWQAAHPDT